MCQSLKQMVVFDKNKTRRAPATATGGIFLKQCGPKGSHKGPIGSRNVPKCFKMFKSAQLFSKTIHSHNNTTKQFQIICIL